MAVKIRLSRRGRKKRPFFRIVVADESSKRDGKTIDNLGYYDPKVNPPKIKVNNKLVNLWLSRGAQPTEAVRKLLKL